MENCPVENRSETSLEATQVNLSKALLTILVLTLYLTITSCGKVSDEQINEVMAVQSKNADDLLIVDCLLPGKIKKLGKMMYQSKRRAIKTTAAVCEIRGGEYTAYDRSDFSTALNVWLPQAKAGDQEAQTYVGEIYQKGLGIDPQYEIAAEWYKKAAKQGSSRAQMNLGFLFEKGLGVTKDSKKALTYYRQASGLGELLEADSNTLSTEERFELEALRKEVEKSRSERESLRRQLDKTKQDLNNSERQLKKQEGSLKKRQSELQQARLDLEKKRNQPAGVDPTALKNAEKVLLSRETELQKSQLEIASLKKKVQVNEEKLSSYQSKITDYEQKFASLPEPVIEVHDPRIIATRGMKIASVSSARSRHEIMGKVWAPAGLANFEVNGAKEQLKPDGVFKIQIPATKKNKKIKVSMMAVDVRGRKAVSEFDLSPDMITAKPASSTTNFSDIRFGKYYALIIGNNAYKRLPKLKSAIYDAESVSETLKNKYGFETEVLIDATRYDILAALNNHLKKLTEKDNFLLYYAGHGELDTKNSRGYWLPVDADQDSNVNWIPSFAITDILNNMTAKQIIVVADTCYSGILTRSAIARLQPGMSDEMRYNYLKSMANKRSRMVLSSGELKPVLDAGGGKHSIFAKAFLDVLESNDEILEGWNLYNRVSKIVTYTSERFGYQQVPQYSALIRGGHESGGFFFVPKNLGR